MNTLRTIGIMLTSRKRCLTGGLLAVVVVLMAPASWGQTHVWSQRFGDTSVDAGVDIAVDKDGNSLVTGEFSGTVDFGGGPLASAGVSDVFVAKFDVDGNHAWSKRFGDTAFDDAGGIAVDGNGNVFACGYFEGTVDFGGGPLTSAGQNDMFLAKFDPDGNHAWSKRFGGTLFDYAEAIAVDGSGNVILTGSFRNAVDFGGGALNSTGGWDIVVAKFDPDGNHVWSDPYGASDSDRGFGVAVDATGNITVVGSFDNAVDFGGGALTTAGSSDIFVVRFDPDGNHVWSDRFGDSSFDRGATVAMDGLGNAIMSGYFSGTADFGGGPLTSAGGFDVFVAKYDATGNHLWSNRFGDTGSDEGLAVAFDSANRPVLTGRFEGTVDFGGGPLTSAGGVDSDIFIAHYAPDGNHMWSRHYGDQQDDRCDGVAVDDLGKVLVTGAFQGAVNFGGGMLNSAGSRDLFVAKFEAPPLAATLQAFGAFWRGQHVEVSWCLIDIEGSMAFDISRKAASDDGFVRVYAPDIERRSNEFVFADLSTQPGTTYHYKVVVFEDTDPVTSFETTITTPAAALALEQNHPNPFNPTTRIAFSLDRAADVTLRIYDVTGRMITTLVAGRVSAGPHGSEWDGRDGSGRVVASGIYFYRLAVGNRTLTRRALLLK